MKNTALLVMDYQNGIVKMVEAQAPALLTNIKNLLQAARRAGALVVHVRVAFRSGYPEVSSRNKSFGALKNSGRMISGAPDAAIHSDVAPLETEVVVTKHRVGAFSETEMQTVLRAHGIEHLVLAGISTSGVVLSTIRCAADLDYGLTVVADACTDPDEQVHKLLMEKIFPRQADVVTTETALGLFKN